MTGLPDTPTGGTYLYAEMLAEQFKAERDVALNEVERLRAELDREVEAGEAARDRVIELRAELDRRTDPELAARLRAAAKSQGPGWRIDSDVLRAAADLIDGSDR